MSVRDFSARTAVRPAVPAWVVFSLPAAAFASVLFAAQSARTTRETAAADLQRVQREVEDTRARAASLRREARGVSSTDAPAPVVAALASTMPDDVRLQALALTWDRELRLRLQVEAQSAEAWDLFIQQLATHPRFASVLPGEETREGNVRATVTATWRP